jgi:DNA-binding transcriptional ArsR family regulator
MDIEQKRRKEARWRILRILDAGRPIGASETIIATVLGDTKMEGTRDAVRRELDCLRELGLVEVSDLDDGTRFARLTADGVDVVEYTAAAPAGIARPTRT